MTEKKRIPITNKSTGETYYSGPYPGRKERPQASDSADGAAESKPSPATLTQSESTLVAENANEQVSSQVAENPVQAERNAKASSKHEKIESLADYIEYAYGRKGQKLADLKEKASLVRNLAKNFRLGEREPSLLDTASKDSTLAVPRHLLFASREFQGYPSLRSELHGFVKKAILQHPLFRESPALTAFINQGDSSPTALEAIRLISEFGTKKESHSLDFNRTELEALRRNASYLVTVWLREMLGRSLHDVAELLFQGVWKKAASSLADETDKLRAVTDITELVAAGVACELFQQRAEEQSARASQAVLEVENLRQECHSLRAEKESLAAKVGELSELLEMERRKNQEEMARLMSNQDVEVTHLRDDSQQVRHRLVKRLVSDVEQLEIGLSALRNPTPRVEVMIQRAERVVDALRAEIEKLKEV